MLGLVSSLPTAATALAQALARRLHTSGQASRRLVARAWTVQGIVWAALGSCWLLPPPYAVICLCVMIVIGWGSGGLAVPAWTALVVEAVERERHGWFFGLRGTAQQFGVVAAILGGATLLWTARDRGAEAAGFVALFLIAGIARAAGTGLLAGVGALPRERPRPRASGWAALRGSRRFRRLAVYLWMLHLGTYMATPFFVPYMLADLHLSYMQIGLLLAVPAVVKIVTVRSWGRAADRFGPGPLLRISGWWIAPVPALWLISPSPWWILVAQVVSGLSWGAFEVAQASALLQTTRGRANAVGIFNLVDGGAILAGSLAGGVIVHVADTFGMSGYLAAMGGSAVLRLLAALLLLHRVREIGHPSFRYAQIPVRLWAVRPTRGLVIRPWAGSLRPNGDDAEEEAGIDAENDDGDAVGSESRDDDPR